MVAPRGRGGERPHSATRARCGSRVSTCRRQMSSGRRCGNRSAAIGPMGLRDGRGRRRGLWDWSPARGSADGRGSAKRARLSEYPRCCQNIAAEPGAQALDGEEITAISAPFSSDPVGPTTLVDSRFSVRESPHRRPADPRPAPRSRGGAPAGTHRPGAGRAAARDAPSGSGVRVLDHGFHGSHGSSKSARPGSARAASRVGAGRARSPDPGSLHPRSESPLYSVTTFVDLAPDPLSTLCPLIHAAHSTRSRHLSIWLLTPYPR
jgi:hypothetical protein